MRDGVGWSLGSSRLWISAHGSFSAARAVVMAAMPARLLISAGVAAPRAEQQAVVLLLPELAERGLVAALGFTLMLLISAVFLSLVAHASAPVGPARNFWIRPQ